MLCTFIYAIPDYGQYNDKYIIFSWYSDRMKVPRRNLDFRAIFKSFPFLDILRSWTRLKTNSWTKKYLQFSSCCSFIYVSYRKNRRYNTYIMELALTCSRQGCNFEFIDSFWLILLTMIEGFVLFWCCCPIDFR